MREVKVYQKDNMLYADKECNNLIGGNMGFTYEDASSTAEVTLQLIKQGVSVDDIIKLKNQELL